MTGSDCFLTSASSLEDGGVEWKLITCTEGSLSDLIENLEKNGCRVELKSAVHLSKESLLANRQEEIIRAAFEKGYYNYPKKIISEHFCRKTWNF